MNTRCLCEKQKITLLVVGLLKNCFNKSIVSFSTKRIIFSISIGNSASNIIAKFFGIPRIDIMYFLLVFI